MFNILLNTWACSQALHKWLSVSIMVWYLFDDLVSICFFQSTDDQIIILWYRWACSEALHKWLSVSRWSRLTAAAKAWGMWEMATSKNRWKADDGWFAFLEKKYKYCFHEKGFRKRLYKQAWEMTTSKNRWKADDRWFAFLETKKKQNFAFKKTAKKHRKNCESCPIQVTWKRTDISYEGKRDVRDGNKQEQTMRYLHFGEKNTNIPLWKGI